MNNIKMLPYDTVIVEKCFVSDSNSLTLLHTHNLRSLYNKIITKSELSVDSKSCKWLGDFIAFKAF